MKKPDPLQLIRSSALTGVVLCDFDFLHEILPITPIHAWVGIGCIAAHEVVYLLHESGLRLFGIGDYWFIWK